MSYKTTFYSLFDFLFLVITITLFFLRDNQNIIVLFGYLIIILSLYLIFKTRKNTKLLFLFSIIGLINVSLGINDFIKRGVDIASWQIPLRSTVYNLEAAYSVLILLTILNLFISRKWVQRNSINVYGNELVRENNSIIAYTGIFTLFVIIIYAIVSKRASIGGGYVSTGNPIYEYSLVVYLITWFFAKNLKKINFFLVIYSALYVFLFMLIGDRSAAFMMILLFFLIHYEKYLNLKRITLLTLAAIFSANVIGIIRNAHGYPFIEVLKMVVEKGFYVDTVSYAYYASIAITSINHLANNTLYLFFKYIQSLFLGSNEYSILPQYAEANFIGMRNAGGGMYTSYFYAWGGLIGVILGSIILGVIIRKVYTNKNRKRYIYQILIPVFALRWYLYSPTTLFRSIFILTFAFFTFVNVMNSVMKKLNRTSQSAKLNNRSE